MSKRTTTSVKLTRADRREIAAAVTRRTVDGTAFNPAQALTVGEALHLFTGRAAQITTNRGVGVLTAGSDASFVVLDADPFALDPAELGRVRAREVWLRGVRAR